jgi:hypothetical protein
VAAVEGALNAILTSPAFLYRSEAGVPIPGRSDLRALGGDEIATRLGFLATLAPPDAELRAAARAGRLADGAERVRQLDRLAATDLGRHARAVFVLEWLGANESKIMLKSSGYQRDLGGDFDREVRASAEAAIRHVLVESDDPTVAGLLTTRAYLSDPAIEKVTRAAGTGKKASGDTEETERMGLLMHPQVLAAHTKENGASPFQIGAFIREALLCEPVPAPPADAAAAARTDVPPGLSARESLEHRTSVGRACTACHGTFSALGYAFLPFDPIGRWVKQDPSGKPWDLAGSVRTHGGAAVSFQSPAELARSLAHHPQVHGCFAQAALEWTLGRALVPEDRALVGTLDEVARRTHGDVAAIFRAIVAAPGFATTVVPR